MASSEKIRQAVEILNNGGIIIFPTETVYGIGCKISDREAVKKIYDIKQRDYGRPFLLHLDNIDNIEPYIEEYKKEFFDRFSKYIPGPLSFVMKHREGIDLSYLNGGLETIGFRVPDNNTTREIIKLIGEPLIGTSVNYSGMPPAVKIDDIPKEILNSVDLYINEGETNGTPSTVIAFTQDKIEVLRKGDKWEEILNEIGK